MIENGFAPDLTPAEAEQLTVLARHPPLVANAPGVRDLRSLPWSSIDNHTSRDLDQLEVAERLAGGVIRVQVAIADVDAFVPKGSPIDGHAARETTSVYAGVRMFPMLPEALSTSATSLLQGAEKLAVVVEFEVGPDGEIGSTAHYRALVRNQAQLTYDAVGAWLEGRGAAPAALDSSAALQEQVRIQDLAAQSLRLARCRHGALNIEGIGTRPVVVNGQVTGLEAEQKNRAGELIEDFMIAANEVVARMLEARRVSSIRRVVKTPRRWARIVELAANLGTTLPAEPDSKALNDFLLARKRADPDHFADVSLAAVKLMGPGEYVLERPGESGQGHFGLAVEDYTHSTAPNRRFADLVTQRLVKAVLAKGEMPYSDDELAAVAARCTEREDSARKVERGMSKRIAAVAMSRRIGEHFDAIVTGVKASNTFVRVLSPHVEGLLARGREGVDVGDRIGVTLIAADVERGFIDFARDTR